MRVNAALSGEEFESWFLSMLELLAPEWSPVGTPKWSEDDKKGIDIYLTDPLSGEQHLVDVCTSLKYKVGTYWKATTAVVCREAVKRYLREDMCNLREFLRSCTALRDGLGEL